MDTLMSKGQQKSNKEVRKPKQEKKPAPQASPAGSAVKQLDPKSGKKK
jgi:hypothetical protein